MLPGKAYNIPESNECQPTHILIKKGCLTMAFQPAFVTEYEDTNMLYELMRESNAQLIEVDKLGSYADVSDANSPTYYTGTDIQTGPDTALEILGFGFKFIAYQDFGTQTSSSGNTASEFDVNWAMTYTQPQPPASNGKTLASTSGNLVFRNRFWQTLLVGVSVFQNLGGATSGVTSYMGQVSREGTVILRRPIRIVGQQLALAYASSASNIGCYTTGRWQVVAKPVHINSNEYVNLVALATGQAILPPSILG